MTYYEKMALTHEELQAIIQRSVILMCMPNQHTALMRSYDDLRKAAENLDQAVIHFEKEKARDANRTNAPEVTF